MILRPIIDIGMRDKTPFHPTRERAHVRLVPFCLQVCEIRKVRIHFYPLFFAQ